MSLLQKYSNFVDDSDKINKVEFGLGMLISLFSSDFNTINDSILNPFLICGTSVICGLIYNILGYNLREIMPNTRFITIPVLTVALLIQVKKFFVNPKIDLI